VTPGQGVICNQWVVSWDFKRGRGHGNADGDNLLPRRAGHRRFFTLRVFFRQSSVSNIDDTLPVLASASGVFPLRFC